MLITLAHSPDADDAFMFYALVKGKIRTNGISFRFELSDIETLNRQAIEGIYDVAAISFAAYPYIYKNYKLLSVGASVGENYGPIVVAKKKLDTLKEKTIAVPGTLTTAYLALKLYEQNFTDRVIAFDKIPQEVISGEVDAGVLIHEGQLNYEGLGLHKVVDLGQWWWNETKLPLPLGGNVIKRSLDIDLAKKVQEIIRQSIKYALEHKDEALGYAIKFARNLDKNRAAKFVGMYVNDYTLDLGQRGKEGLKILFQKANSIGLIKEKVFLEF